MISILKQKILNFNKKKIPSHILKIGKITKAKYVQTHKNNVSVIYLSKKNTYRKFSNNKKGIQKILSEKLGYEWYSKRLNLNKKRLIKSYFTTKKFALIDLQEIRGKKMKSWTPLHKNFELLKKFFKHYLKIYPKKKYTPIHGDLTFDNIIFGKKIMIIDWEFFKANKSLYGYDLSYLILSAACLPYLDDEKFSSEDEKKFKKLWMLLTKNKISKKITRDPFSFFIKKIQTDKVLKDSLKISKKKFFPFITPALHKKRILKIIKSIKYEK